MKTKITQGIPALLALAAIGFRYVSNWCVDSTSYCYGTWVHQVALSVTKPLYFFALFFLPLAIALIIISRNIFNSWLRFAAWTLPLLFIFIAMQPVVSSFLSTDRDDAARLAGEVFAAISLALVIWKSLAARRTE